MDFKEAVKRELRVALHAQSWRFRIIKYVFIFAIAGGVYVWKGLNVLLALLILLTVSAIAIHFLFRWKTEAWTKPWGPYKKIPLPGE